jgi:hypothetical protein
VTSLQVLYSPLGIAQSNKGFSSACPPSFGRKTMPRLV